jgi:hypothetical protein
MLAIIGVPATGACKTLTRWTGRTVVTGKSSLISGQPLSAEFRVQTSRIYDKEGRPLANSLVLQGVKEQLHLLLSRYRLDLKPEIDSLKNLLPYFLPRYPADRLTGMIDSLRIGHLLIRPGGLDVELRIDVETAAKGGPEPILSKHEMHQLEQRYRNWDTFLTFVIKEAATATRSEELRAALLEILLDARYQFMSILSEPSQSTTDPVLQQLFDFGKSGDIIQQKKPHGFNFQLIRPVYAASPRDRLNRWVPAPCRAEVLSTRDSKFIA